MPRSKQKFPNIKGPAAQDICYATENRQVAVKQVASEADLLLVVGSENSSNSNRLVEVARNLGTNAHLIDSCNDIESEWLKGVQDHRADGWSFGAGASGRRDGNVPARQRFRQRAGTGSDARERSLRPAAGDRGSHRRGPAMTGKVAWELLQSLTVGERRDTHVSSKA